jgi:excisionase family DNA binding protein
MPSTAASPGGDDTGAANSDDRPPCPFCSKQLLKIPEASRYLGISVSKGYDLMHAGQFPVSVRKLGSQWRVSKAELDEWLRTPPPPSGDTRLRRV